MAVGLSGLNVMTCSHVGVYYTTSTAWQMSFNEQLHAGDSPWHILHRVVKANESLWHLNSRQVCAVHRGALFELLH